MSKHTPGPWSLLKAPRSRTWEVNAPSWKCLAAVHGNSDPDFNKAGEANAHLIAAAPDLLEALKLAHDHLCVNPGYEGSKEIAQIRAALDKAEGR